MPQANGQNQIQNESSVSPQSPIRGRCTSVSRLSSAQIEVTVQRLEGWEPRHAVFLVTPEVSLPQPGDWIEWDGQNLKVLTRTKKKPGTPSVFTARQTTRRLIALQRRGQIESGIREFFLSRGFSEPRTPLLVPCPGMEPHIRPFRLETGAYLPTSPEFAMKRLLAVGFEKIFQICPAFRYEPTSPTHHPEFTMLEWYRAFANDEDLRVDTEQLVAHLATALYGKPEITYQGKRISLAAPWPRLRVRDLFHTYAGIDLIQKNSAETLAQECVRLGISTPPGLTWDDYYFLIWLNEIEPKLPADRAVFVTRYPASQAALAVTDKDPDGSVWAKRFEAYVGGIELANAFEELTDPVEQRARFVKDMQLRIDTYGTDFPPSPLDEGFLDALEEGIPPSAGIALGVDRLIMLLIDEPEIDQTLWLPSFAGDSSL